MKINNKIIIQNKKMMKTMMIMNKKNFKNMKILNDFKKLLELHFNGPKHRLCGHNAKEFDFPFIARRMLIHQISLPQSLQLFNKKPWEVPHLDTLHL